jgi:hypothetical protein
MFCPSQLLDTLFLVVGNGKRVLVHSEAHHVTDLGELRAVTVLLNGLVVPLRGYRLESTDVDRFGTAGRPGSRSYEASVSEPVPSARVVR